MEGDNSKEVSDHKGIQGARLEHVCSRFNSAWSKSSAVLKMPL